jgi:hypothetical protein
VKKIPGQSRTTRLQKITRPNSGFDSQIDINLETGAFKNCGKNGMKTPFLGKFQMFFTVFQWRDDLCQSLL